MYLALACAQRQQLQGSSCFAQHFYLAAQGQEAVRDPAYPEEGGRAANCEHWAGFWGGLSGARWTWSRAA